MLKDSRFIVLDNLKRLENLGFSFSDKDLSRLNDALRRECFHALFLMYGYKKCKSEIIWKHEITTLNKEGIALTVNNMALICLQ